MLIELQQVKVGKAYIEPSTYYLLQRLFKYIL